MQGRKQKPNLFWTGILVVLSALWTRAPAVAADPLQHELVRGDTAAEAIIEELQAIDPAAPIQIVGKRRKTDQVTGYVYTVLKARHGRKDVTATINEDTGAFAPDSGLARRERQAVLDALPPIYRKMGPPLLRVVRKAQGGVLGGPAGRDRRLAVTIYADSAESLDAIQAAIGNAAFTRFDVPAMFARNPPVVRPSKDGTVTVAAPAPEVRTIMTGLALEQVLRVGALDGVERVELTGKLSPLLDVSVPRIKGDIVKGFGLSGFDTVIAIVDSGVDDTHPNITPLVIAEADFTDAGRLCVRGTREDQRCDCPGGVCLLGECVLGSRHGEACDCPGGGVCEGVEDDTSGHGTHVAGIAVNDSAAFEGMATLADVINAKALDGVGSDHHNAGTFESRVEAAVAWASPQGAKVVNLSLGTTKGCVAPLRCRFPKLCSLPVTNQGDVCEQNTDCDTNQGDGDGRCIIPGACSAPPANQGDRCVANADCHSPAGGDGVCDLRRYPACTVNADCDADGGDGGCVEAGKCSAPAVAADKLCMIDLDCDPTPGVGACQLELPCAVDADCDSTSGAGDGVCLRSDGQRVAVRRVDYEVFTNNVTFAVAAGNTHAFRPGHPLKTSLQTTPADGYNVITVGSSSMAAVPSVVSNFSTRGPTTDHRSKPDVLAPGQGGGPADGIDSTAWNWEGPVDPEFMDWSGICSNTNDSCTDDPSCFQQCSGGANDSLACLDVPGDSDCPGGDCVAAGFCGGQVFVGTSMAAPHVTGLAALLWGYGSDEDILTDTPYLKATIINACNRLAGWDPAGDEPLDRAQGAGEIDAEQAYRAYADDLRVWQQRVTGTDPEDSHWYWIDFDGHDLPFDDPKSMIVVTLVFERHVTNPAVAAPDLNDLNLTLYSPERFLLDQSISPVDSVEHIVHVPLKNGRYCIEVDPFNLDQDGWELYAVACNYRLHFMGNTCPCISDFGDAPDPFTGPGQYPTLLDNSGARHLDWTKEWLGSSRPKIDGELEKGTLDVRSKVDPFPSVSGENDADGLDDQDNVPNLVNNDRRDDGVNLFQGPFRPGGVVVFTVRVQTTVHETGFGANGRYDAGDNRKRLYLNAWCDWDADGIWLTPNEKIIGTLSPTGTVALDPQDFGKNEEYTIGEDYVDSNGSGAWEPGESYTESAGRPGKLFAFRVVAPAIIAPKEFYCRFRLDFGEDVGHILPPSATLREVLGEARFGEVEDYPRDFFQPPDGGGFTIEFDEFPESEVDVDIIVTLPGRGEAIETVTGIGGTAVMVDLESLSDQDGDGLEEVTTEMVGMDLVGYSELLGSPVTIQLRPETSAPFKRTVGVIEEKVNNIPGVLEIVPFTPTGEGSSFFDVYFELSSPALQGTLHNVDASHMVADSIFRKPPPPRNPYMDPRRIFLLDENGAPTNIIIGMKIHKTGPSPDPHATAAGNRSPSSIDFGVGGSNPAIPADFFGPGSDPFVGQVELRGDPIDPPTQGNTSTLVQRSGTPVWPDDSIDTVGTVDLEIVELSLLAAEPITVTYNGGQDPEQWDGAVGLSEVSAPTGSLTARKTHDNGGTFDTILPVQAKFTFTKVSDPSEVRVLDTGLEGIAPIDFSSTGTPFVHVLDPSLDIMAPSNERFVPGVEETVQGDRASQQVVAMTLNDPGAPARHIVVAPAPPPPPLGKCCHAIGLGTTACAEVTEVECNQLPGPVRWNQDDVCTGDVEGDCPVCTPGKCDDGSACTDDVCGPDGTCFYPLNYDPSVDCCDPATGDLTPIDDGDPCTDAVCDPVTGSVSHPPAPPGTPCNDGDPCTVNDRCDGEGGCAGDPVAELPCDEDSDCPPPGVCVGGVCGCPIAQPCCLDGEEGRCELVATVSLCLEQDGEAVDACLGDLNGDGKDDACVPPIPIASAWGLIVLTLLLLTGGKVYFGWRRAAQA